MMFQDRIEAGQKLKEKLKIYKNKKDAVILTIPRGGVVLGFEIAKALNLPLDIVIVRKIGAPGNPEFAVGAVDQNGKILKNPEVRVPPDYLKEEAEKEKKEIERRIKEYRGEKKELVMQGKIVILVDDGVATGLTTLKAVDFIKAKNPQKVILATPVIAKDTAKKIKDEVDELVYLEAPELFFAVGQFYSFFPQVSDEEVKEILKKAQE